jgi:hypothetical protein
MDDKSGDLSLSLSGKMSNETLDSQMVKLDMMHSRQYWNVTA